MEELEKIILAAEDGGQLYPEEPRRRAFLFPVPSPGKHQLLLQACYSGDVSEIRRLVSEDAHRMEELDAGDMGPVLTATSRNQVGSVETLLSLGGDVNETDKTGTSALCYAIVLGFDTLAKLLIDHGADPIGDLQVSGKNRPIHFAAVGNRIELAKYLITKGASLLHKGLANGTPFRSGVIANSLDFVKWAIKTEPLCLEQVDIDNCKFDVTAVECGATSVLKWMVAEGHVVLANIVGQYGLNAFQMAARYGASELVKWFLSLGMRYDEQWGESGFTPLQFAAQEGKIEVIRLLLAAGVDPVTSVDHVGTNSLMWSANNGSLEGVKLFLDAGCPVESKNSSQMTALMFAAQSGHLETMLHLLTVGANIEAADQTGRTPLYFACMDGQLECAVALIERGANPQIRPNDTNILMCSARHGHKKVVEYLAQHFTEMVTETDRDGDTALSLALHNGHVETADWMLSHPELGFSLKDRSLINAVRLAAGNGKLESLQYLYDHGIPFDTPDTSGNTALTYAAHFGHCDAIRFLVEKGADLTSLTEGWQPLHIAARQGQFEAVKALVELGADKLAKVADSGDTALHLACQSGKNELVQYLLDAGINHSDVSERSGQTPMLNAALAGHLSTMLILEKAGAQWDVAARSGWSPAFYSAASGFLDILIESHKRGLDLAASDNLGHTPVLLAAYHGEKETLDYLLKEAKVNPKSMAQSGYGLFAHAVHGGQLELLKHLIEDLTILPVDTEETETDLKQALSIVCARHGKVEIMEYLLSKGLLSLHLPTAVGNHRTPLLEACIEGETEMVQFLARHGCSVRERSAGGATAFMYACQSGQLDLVRWMMSIGCSPFDVDSAGLNAIDYASDNGNVVQLLSQLTADIVL